MSGDSTLVPREAEAPSGVTNQDGLDALLAKKPIDEEESFAEEDEPSDDTSEEMEDVKEEAPQKYFGRFESLEAAEKSYRDMQTAYQRAKEELKSVRREKDKEQLERFDTLDPDEQVKLLAKQVAQLKEQLTTTTSSAQEREVAEYVQKNKVLRESGMDEVFMELALSPKYRDYTLDSVFNSVFKPRIDKLMGRKVKVKEKPVYGNSDVDTLPLNDVSRLSPDQYQKHREKVLRSAGIKT